MHLEELSKSRPVIVYATEPWAVYLQNTLTSASIVSSDVPANELRDCELAKVGSSHRILVVTDPLMMRGIDFRAQNLGFNLLITRGFASQRDAHQALMRASRRGESCRRLISS